MTQIIKNNISLFLKVPSTSSLVIHCGQDKGSILNLERGKGFCFIVATKQSPALLEHCPVFKGYLLADIVDITSLSPLLRLQFRDYSCLHLCNIKQGSRGHDKLKTVYKPIPGTSAKRATKWRSLGPSTLKTNLPLLTCS